MNITEEKRDLFTVPAYYHLAHCISADKTLGAGIAKRFNEYYNISERLNEYDDGIYVGEAYPISNVFNLVTKECYDDEADIVELFHALVYMRDLMTECKLKYLAIPKLGCGRDKLNWDTVKNLIEDVFYYTDIEILICLID